MRLLAGWGRDNEVHDLADFGQEEAIMSSKSIIRKYNKDLVHVLTLSEPSRKMLTIALFGKDVISEMEKHQVFESNGVNAANHLVAYITDRVDGKHGDKIWTEMEEIEALKETVEKMKQEMKTSSSSASHQNTKGASKNSSMSQRPSDILRHQLPDLSNAVMNVEQLADRLRASDLIPHATVDRILQETTVRYQRASRLFSEIHRLLTLQLKGLDPRDMLQRLCEVLKAQNEPALTLIAEEMLEELQ